jgi:hypothetical protein
MDGKGKQMTAITTSEAEDWCRRNGVEIEFYEKQEESRSIPFVGLSKDDLQLEKEYSGGMLGVVLHDAVRDFEELMRQAGMKVK